ncbi:MAG: hypothetical protein JST84_10410 [Acidobacteria bacterium]|nr:hypothetical protein [Acidobacteriota bacterium]
MENPESAASDSSKTNNKRKPKRERVSPGHPPQRVEIESATLDIPRVDKETGLLLGQPICTIFIDKATRCILNVLISQP